MAVEEVTCARFAIPVITLHYFLAAQEYHYRKSFELPAFIKVVIRAVMGYIDAIMDCFCGVPNGDIGIGSGNEGALLRV